MGGDSITTSSVPTDSRNHPVRSCTAPTARSEDEVLHDAVERLHGSSISIATMRREHVEIKRLSAELSDLHGSPVVSHEPSEETTRALRRVPYGLHAVISLHFVKEDEILMPRMESRLPARERENLLTRLRSLAA
ncbi:MAG: hemerythrin domain-containing protein [Acidimicrobiales bacterium]